MRPLSFKILLFAQLCLLSTCVLAKSVPTTNDEDQDLTQSFVKEIDDLGELDSPAVEEEADKTRVKRSPMRPHHQTR